MLASTVFTLNIILECLDLPLQPVHAPTKITCTVVCARETTCLVSYFNPINEHCFLLTKDDKVNKSHRQNCLFMKADSGRQIAAFAESSEEIQTDSRKQIMVLGEGPKEIKVPCFDLEKEARNRHRKKDCCVFNNGYFTNVMSGIGIPCRRFCPFFERFNKGTLLTVAAEIDVTAKEAQFRLYLKGTKDCRIFVYLNPHIKRLFVIVHNNGISRNIPFPTKVHHKEKAFLAFLLDIPGDRVVIFDLRNHVILYTAYNLGISGPLRPRLALFTPRGVKLKLKVYSCGELYLDKQNLDVLQETTQTK